MKHDDPKEDCIITRNEFIVLWPKAQNRISETAEIIWIAINDNAYKQLKHIEQSRDIEKIVLVFQEFIKEFKKTLYLEDAVTKNQDLVYQFHDN